MKGRIDSSAVKMEPVGVLFASHASGLYGAERFLRDVLPALPARIKPLLLAPARGPLTEWAAGRGIECLVVPSYGWQGHRFRVLKGACRLTWNLTVLPRVLRQTRGRGIKLVYSNTLHSLFGALVAWAIRAPHIWHAHEFPEGEFLGRFDFGLRGSMRFVAAHSDLIVCNSMTLRNCMARYVPETKLRVVQNGVIEESDGKGGAKAGRTGIHQNERLNLLMVGSLSANKGHIDAFRAVRHLRQLGKNVVLTIVGDGDRDYQTALVKSGRNLGIEDSVRFAGFQNELDAFYREADIVLVCSRAETFGRVIVEAMSFGCPVVASDTGGIPEIVANRVNGLLYKPTDFRGLAAAVLTLIDDPGLYAGISLRSLEGVAGRFSIDKSVSELLAVVDEALKGEHGIGVSGGALPASLSDSSIEGRGAR